PAFRPRHGALLVRLSLPTRRSSDLSPSRQQYDRSQKPHSGSPDHPHTTMSDAVSPANTGQTPPNQRNHPDSLPHPQDAPSCHTCAPGSANATKSPGKNRLQPSAGSAKTPRHEQKGQWGPPSGTATALPTLSPECTRTRLGSGIVLSPHQVVDQ